MDHEGRPMPHLTADAYSTTVRLHDFLHNCQPETRAMSLSARAGRIHLVKAIEETRQRFTRDAYA